MPNELRNEAQPRSFTSHELTLSPLQQCNSSFHIHSKRRSLLKSNRTKILNGTNDDKLQYCIMSCRLRTKTAACSLCNAPRELHKHQPFQTQKDQCTNHTYFMLLFFLFKGVLLVISVMVHFVNPKWCFAAPSQLSTNNAFLFFCFLQYTCFTYLCFSMNRTHFHILYCHL